MCVSTPKVPKPTPVVERQAYKSPVPRSSLSSGDGDARRRMIAGIATSAMGLSPESTTKRVRTGGDQAILPALSPATTSPTSVVPATTTTGPVTAAQTKSASTIPMAILGLRSINRPKNQTAAAY